MERTTEVVVIEQADKSMLFGYHHKNVILLWIAVELLLGY